MKKVSLYKRKLYFTIAILFIICMGIGYAILSERLSVDTSISYSEMKWDVGFDQVIELNSADYNNSLIANTSISSDKKSISLSCDLGSNTSKIDCISRVTIKNNSTFDVVLKSFVENGIDDYEDYIADSYFNWYDTENNSETKVRVGYVLAAGETATLNIKYIFKALTADLLPPKGLEMSFDFEMEWIQDDGVSISPYNIGDVIDIGGEKFNIISYDDETITMLAQYGLNGNYIQSDSRHGVMFTTSCTWEYTPGPKEIDIDVSSPNIKVYLDAYQELLQYSVWDGTLSVDLITMKQLKDLGCSVSDDYSVSSGFTCSNSPYATDWLINGQDWWTKSASSSSEYHVWYVSSYGAVYNADYLSYYGVRPVVTLSIDALENNILPFSIDGVTYESAPPRIWSEWINSEYNVDGYRNSGGEIISPNGDVVYGVDDRDVIIHNHDYRTVFSFEVFFQDAYTGEIGYADSPVAYINSTWRDFIDSDLNISGFRISDDGYVIFNNVKTSIDADDYIIKNHQYFVQVDEL